MFLKNTLFVIIILIGMVFLTIEVLPGSRGFPPTQQKADLQDIQIVARRVDQQFEEKWKLKNIPAADQADNLIVARRLSLGLTGTIPSLEEIRQLEQVEPDNQIDWWTDYLLKDQRYYDYVAERLARAYVGVEDGPFILYRRRRFVMWLSEQLRENRGYDQLVKDLLSDKGLWTDTPSVNFYTVTVQEDHPDPIRLAARTTRAFLGLRIDCLQCHDDALGTMELGELGNTRTGMQEDFHQLAAAFSSTRQTFAGIQDSEETQPYRFKFLNEEDERSVDFNVPFRADLLPAGGNDRMRLAAWVTHPENPAFARAIVNRIWAIMTGKPLIDPVDDIPLYGQRPPGMDLLAEDFVQHGYDLKRLIRIIAQTQVFQKNSTASFEVEEKHESSWAVYPQNPLRPEQVVGSLVQATSLKTINDDSNVFQKLFTFGDTNDFIVRYGDPGEDEFRDRNETIQQKNIMMNGKVVGERTRASGLLVNAAGQISRFCDSNEKIVETLYLVVLSRRPTDQESQFLTEHLEQCQSENEKMRAVEDILWALFNKLEFLRTH